ncbi:type IV pilus assembly protein FimV [Stutzerimonas azotifigens]|uniref:Peptidoglycan-binding protein LysM n=1 Tax=Stutzerimonas azotifigens TaxID=291995 RepID=A0ABR5YWM4_9GAMM|nr:peptidoglycan-binding protein LysM [Stutzerimonas azotifigens]MBA1272326.1 peptidoglycan-binding protein LysM [Stutzerimonas azotifigens]
MARLFSSLICLLGTLGFPGGAWALGMGDITLRSALHQPLDAEIQLLDVQGLDASEIKVSLASPSVFARSGVDYPQHLMDLRFSTQLRGSDGSIRVTTSAPIREPYLNFIVELVRPNGTLLREYTVLLDPIETMASWVPPVPQTAPVRPLREASPVVSATATPAPQAAPAASLGQRYAVRRGDSLWLIAHRLSADGSAASVERLIRDIHALNPQAFAAGDVSRLLSGTSLLLPDRVELGGPATMAERVTQPAVTPAVETMPSAEDEIVRLLAEQRKLDEQVAIEQGVRDDLRDQIQAFQVRLDELMAMVEERDRLLVQLTQQLAKVRQASAPKAVQPAAPAIAEVEAAISPARDDALPGDWRLWLAVLVLLLALSGLFWRSRRSAEQTPEPVPATVTTRRRTAEPVDAVEEPSKDDPFDRLEVQPEQPVPVAEPHVAQVAAEPVPPRGLPSASDALDAARLYMAYGRYKQARHTLEAALLVEPTRNAMRLKLLEVLSELGDGPAFAQELARARELGVSDVQLDAIRPPASLPLLEEILEPPKQEAPEETEYTGLDLDSFSLDADWDLISPFRPSAGQRKAAPDEALEDPEFNSNLHELPEVLEIDEVTEFFSEPAVDVTDAPQQDTRTARRA